MSLEMAWTIFFWGCVSLLILAIAVIWIVILATTWAVVNKFLKQYSDSRKALTAEEARAAVNEASERALGPDY